ncbi:MAG: hypothetical protein ACTHM4_03685 [Rhodanobacteraceae bacterium]|jgi:hypothetical protein
MAPVPFLIAFAVAGGHVTFAGTVATPTAPNVPMVTPSSSRSTAPAAAQIGRFDDPPRVVTIQSLGDADGRSEIVVKYL